MSLETALQAIDETKTYSLNEIVKSGLIPFIKSYHTAHKEVLNEGFMPKNQRVLDALIMGEGRARTIRIKGANLKRYVEANAERIK